MTNTRSASLARGIFCSLALSSTLGCSTGRLEVLPVEVIPVGPSRESGGCSGSSEAGIHYSSTRTVEQRIPRRWVETVEMRPAYANVRVVFVDTKDIVLVTTGTFSIQGYHGSCEAAGVKPVSPGELTLRATMEGYRLVLESPTRSHLHHSTSLEEIELRVPRRIEVVVSGQDRR